MIDEKYQNKGFGREALKLGINFVKEKFNPDSIYSGNIYGNEMWGKYTCNGHRITISPPWTTLVDCEGSDPDEFFRNHIDDVYSYVVTNTELRLYYSDNEYFKFRVKK